MTARLLAGPLRHPRRLRAAARGCALFALASLAASCGGAVAEPELDVELRLTPDPPRVGQAEAVVLVHESDGSPVTGAAVGLEANMNHAGMVPVLADTRETEPGRYEAELELTMGGDWFVVVTTRLADGGTAETVVEVPGVRPEGE